jgi:hypothetical protein
MNSYSNLRLYFIFFQPSPKFHVLSQFLATAMWHLKLQSFSSSNSSLHHVRSLRIDPDDSRRRRGRHRRRVGGKRVRSRRRKSGHFGLWIWFRIYFCRGVVCARPARLSAHVVHRHQALQDRGEGRSRTGAEGNRLPS